MDKIFASVQRLVDAGAFDKAAHELRAAAKASPGDPRIWLKIAEMEERAGNRDAAIKGYRKAADIYSERGSYLQTVAVYKNKLLQLAPEMVSVHVHLAELYHHLGLMDDALEQFRRAGSEADA